MVRSGRLPVDTRGPCWCNPFGGLVISKTSSVIESSYVLLGNGFTLNPIDSNFPILSPHIF